MSPHDDNRLVVMWGAKGGVGTTVTAAGTALGDPDPVLLVDLDGDTAAVLGVTPVDLGLKAWLASEAEPDRLIEFIEPVADNTTLLPAGHVDPDSGTYRPERLDELAAWLRSRPHTVIVDAGTGTPPPQLTSVAHTNTLVTRNDYLALTNAWRSPITPDNIVVVHDPTRSLTVADVEATLGAPVVATVEVDPSSARAVDAGLFTARNSLTRATAAITGHRVVADEPAPTQATATPPPEIDYGMNWQDPTTGDTWRVSYDPGTGTLHAFNNHTWQREPLGQFPDQAAVEVALEGWGTRHRDADGLNWVHEQAGTSQPSGPTVPGDPAHGDRIDLLAMMNPDPPEPGADTDMYPTIQHPSP